MPQMVPLRGVIEVAALFHVLPGIVPAGDPKEGKVLRKTGRCVRLCDHRILFKEVLQGQPQDLFHLIRGEGVMVVGENPPGRRSPSPARALDHVERAEDCNA